MDLNALKLFVEIVDGGSLSVAARRLKTTRSSVSHRLNAFEKELGAQLLRRTTRRIEPTQVGYALYEHGSRIVREIDAANETIASLGKRLHGHVRVSVPIAIGHLYLGPILIEFAKEHPQVTLEVVFNNRVFDLITSEIDVALRVTSDPPPQYVAKELAKIELKLCASPEYLHHRKLPREPIDLMDHVFISRSAQGDIQIPITLTKGGQSSKISVPPHIQTENTIFMKNAALAGIGFAALPYYAVRNEIEEGRLITLLDDYKVDLQGDKLFILTAPNRYPTAAIVTLMEFIKSKIQPSFLVP